MITEEIFSLFMVVIVGYEDIGGSFHVQVLTVVGVILPSVCFVFVCLLNLFLCVAAESYIEFVDKELCELTGWNYGYLIVLSVECINHYHLPLW
jgi:hypothetical protein